jgi:hypothetical protein
MAIDYFRFLKKINECSSPSASLGKREKQKSSKAPKAFGPFC